jgi:CPA1 family monovalent cation:H+ antiporter
MFDVAATCLVITAILSFLNHRFVRLPTTIGVMVIALVLSLTFVALDAAGWSHALRRYEESLLSSIDFSDLLMQGMLSLLLFAGALHVDFSALRAQRWPVLALALFGTLLSTALVGFGLWLAAPMAGLELSPLYCMLFGALISPTDPIAVMSILKSAGASKDVELVIAGESLFNDGVGVVVFASLAAMLSSAGPPTASSVIALLAREAVGGIVFGLVLGYATYLMLKSIDEYQVEVLLTLAAVTGGYALASHLHISGPLAMVICGLVIGNHGRERAMSDTTRRYVDMFWELIDGILNAVLFLLIGMEVLLVMFSPPVLTAAVVAVCVTLLARLLSVGLPIAAFGRHFGLPDRAWRVLTWGGLRGGISVALSLSLPAGTERDIVLALTYCVVVFSILVQGLTIGYVVRGTLIRTLTRYRAAQ